MQASPQAEQSLEVPSWVSQPSVSKELQSSHPESQAPISQAPPLHTPEAWLYEQSSPQDEQLEGVPSWVSQPLPQSLSQLSHPLLQTQLPEVQWA
ncbi:unnamed protein product [marine sediment metagenome]|uniref:Uncharacterized protein n=1 Tax=marine sediment metagenome TaxID=412755 RepID=X0V840_9ZZZZ